MLPFDEHLRTQLDLLHTLFPDIKKDIEKREKHKEKQQKEPRK